MDEAPTRPPSSRVITMGAGSSLRAFRQTGGFEATVARFLHTRLRLAATFVLAVAAILLLAAVGSWILSGDNLKDPFFTQGRTTLVVLVCVAAVYQIPLRKNNLSSASLNMLDAALTTILIAGGTVYYWASYEKGPVLLVPILGLLLVARAVFVPSRAARTFILSVLAAPAVAWVALAHKAMYSLDGVQLSKGSYDAHVMWEQVFIWLCIGLACFASHANFALRFQAWKATEVGQYQMIERIGAGAMGEVWRAQHGMMRRPTAIKIIRADVVDEKTLKRFEEEVRQTCRLTHPNVVAIYDFGRTADGVFFYAMELLDGDDLWEIVAKSGPMPAARAIHVLVQACAGLAEAHARGLVHRDVKSANLYLCERGLESDVVKVMDFGLVKDVSEDTGQTSAGEVCGTPETIAPESIRGRPPTALIDVYALGAVGCFLVTGRPIFDVRAPLEFINAHLNDEPVRPSARNATVPPDLERVLLDCLVKDPAKRIQSVLELRRRLLDCEDAHAWKPEDAAAWWKTWRERRHLEAADAAAPTMH